MKIPQFFSRIPYKKYIAGFLVSVILISQTIHVDFFDSALAGPENYRDIVSIIVDEDTYRSQRSKILRYADDIAGYLGGVRTSIFVVDKNTPVPAIATKNEKLYYEGDGEKGASILVGTILIGNIPIPMVEKDGANFPSLYPYVDFDDKVFIYNNKSEQYSFNEEDNGVESAEIWHGVINPAAGRNWSGANDIQKIGQFLDKTHDFYTKSGKFALSTIPPKVFYYDGLSEGKSINPRALFQYSLYIKNIENMAYSRYTKHLLRDITKILNDFDKKTEDPEITDMFAELGISPGNDTLSEEQIKKLPDIQSKNVILGFLKNFKGIFNEKTLGDELLAVHNAGRYTSGATVRTDLVPVSISLMDELARSALYEANVALEKKIDSIIVDNKYARRIPIFDEIRYASGHALNWNSSYTTILQNYAFGNRSTNIKEALDCTIARGNVGDIAQFGRAELVEANVAFDVLKTESQVNTLKTDTDLLIGMGKGNCFPGNKPKIDSYWGGNSILRIAGGTGDPADVLEKYPATTQFKGFTAPIFSLQGMKETDRLTTGSVKDCLKSPYQYTMPPARTMTDTDPITGDTCSTAYPSEWTSGTCGGSKGTPRFTCISSVSHSGTNFDFESAVDEFKSNGSSKYFSKVGIFGSLIQGDCHNGKLTLDGSAIFTKNNICTVTYEAYDGSGNVMAGDTIDITDYKDMDFHTIPSLMKHVSPTNTEINAAQSSGITPGLAVDMVRYVEFYTPKGNVARINYPNFFDIPSADIASARVWIKAQADTEWQKIINAENATSTSAKYNKANGYLSAGTLPSAPIDWNQYISDEMVLKILQAKHWLHPDTSLKYRQAIEAMLSYSHENTSVTPLVDNPPKIPSPSTEYEIAYLGLPSTFAADFGQSTYSNSMAEYEAKLREVEGVNISDESKNDAVGAGSSNAASECGPPEGVPLFQWPSAIMCWIAAQFPPKILAGSCSPTTIGMDSDKGKTSVAPAEKIAQDPNALKNFYAGSRVIPHLPRSSMNLKDNIVVDLSLQKGGNNLITIPDTIAHLEIVSVTESGKAVDGANLGNYIQISPENSLVGDKGASFILESLGTPSVVTFKAYYSQPLPGGSELRIDSSEFQVEVTPEYYTFGLEQSGASIVNIDATSADPISLRIKKVLKDESEVIVKTPVRIRILDDVDGTVIYTGATFNPSQDSLPTSITKKVGAYRFIAEDSTGVSGEFTFAVEPGVLSQVRIVPVSSALVRGTRTLATVRLLDRIGNPIYPDVHSLKLDITGGYLVDSSGEKKTSMKMDIMEAQIPVVIGSDDSGTLSITATIDDALLTGTKDIAIYNSAKIVLMRGSNPRVGGDPIPTHIEIQDNSGKKISGLSSVASWKFPDGAGSFSKELITITDGLSEDFNYIPGTVAGNHSLSIDIPGIGSLSDIVFSLLPGDPLYISHTKDDENIIFSLRDRYGNIASSVTLAGTLARNTEIPQAVIFTNGVYTMPIIGGYYTVDVPGLKNYSISYTDEYGVHTVSGIDRYVAYIIGKDERVRFAPDYNARYTVFAGGSFLREGEEVLYNVTPGQSQSLAVSTVLDSPYKEDTLVSLLPGGAYAIGTTAEDVALQSSISLSEGFPLLTISDLVTRKQAARVLYHMQGATLETCKQAAGSSCFNPKTTPTIRLITPENTDLTMSTSGDKVLLNSQGANILSVQNDGFINSLSSITLAPNDANKLGLGMSVMQNGKEIAQILYLTDSSLSVERANKATTQTPRNTPVILSSGFSIQKMYGKVFQSPVLGYKIFRAAEANELDETKSGPIDSDSIGALSEIPGVGWKGNNTMLLAYAGGDTVGESTKFFHTYTLVNLGDPVAHIDHNRPGTEIDGIDRTLGSIIARGTRSGIADFFHRDMNADGNTDLIVLYQDGYVELFLNLGGKFRSRGMIAYNKDLGTSQIKFGDFTHDGYGDILGVNKEGSLILVDNSIRKFSRPTITLEGGAPVPKHISQFHIYDMDADALDDITYITAGGELGILYGTVTPGNFVKKILDPTLGISLSEDPITTGGAVRADNTPRFVGPLGVSPVENTESDDDTMLKDEVYYQYVHPAPGISEDTDFATLSGVYTDITNGRTGQSEDTFVRSQYAVAHGLSIEKKYTNTTHVTLYPDDLIQARISIKNTTSQTIKNVEYLDVIPKIFSLDATEKYTVSIGGTSIDRPFEALSNGDYDMYFVGRDIPPGQTLEITYDMVALPASYGEMIVGDLERNTVGSDIYGDVGFKTSTTCGASMLLWTSGPGARDYTKGTHEFGAATLPDGLASRLADSDKNAVPDSIENLSLAERQKTYSDMTTSNSENKPFVKVTQNGGGEMTIGFDSESEDSIIDATQNLLDGLACGFGGGGCMSFPMNWAPLAPGSDPVMFGKLLGDGLIIDEGLPIFAALTCMPTPVYCGTNICTLGIPTVWPASVLRLDYMSISAGFPTPGGCGTSKFEPGAGGMLGIDAYANFLRIFVTPTLTLGVGTAICLGGPAGKMGKIPPKALSPFIQGGNCIVMAKPMAYCKGDGSIADGNVAPISGLGTLSDTWNASSCNLKVSGGTETQNQTITTDIVKYLKSPDKSMLAGIYNNMSKRGAQSISMGPMLRVGNASGGGGAGNVEIEIDSNTKLSDISKVVKLKNIRIPAFPDFLMDWLTRQTEELVTALFTPPNLTIIPPSDFGQNASPDSSFDGISKKLGSLYSNANIDNIKQGMSTAMDGKKPNTDAMMSDAKGTMNTLKSAYTTIGKLPYIKIHQVNIPFNIPWLKMSELDKYGKALDGYLKEIDKAMKNMCISDTSPACLDKKLKIQSGPFINSIRENLKRIEEYKRFPMKVIKYLTWKERYISQILCNINTIQQITGGWLRDNGIRFRKWAELFVLIKSIADGWQPLLDIFLDTSVSCGVCRNERGNAQSWKFKLISALLPSIPVIKFPKWPDIILDLSDIRFAIKFGMPNFDIRFSPIRLPNLPSLSIGDLSAGISLPALPILPALPPLPELPDLPSLPKIKLPDLPPPPKVPKIAGSLKMFLKILKLISKMYCYYQKTVLIPEWQVGDVIAQRTERQGTSLFDFLTLAMPQFSLPTLKEIRIATHVNFELKSDFIAEFSRAAVKPVNKFGTDLQNILPKKVGEDVGIQSTKIDLNKKIPYNIEKDIHTASGFMAQIFAELESEKDVFLDVEDFTTYLLSELDDPEFADIRIALERELSVARIESEKVQNELVAYNDKKFDLLRDYLSAENDNNAQLRNIIDLLMTDFEGEPRQLVADVSKISSRSNNLLKKFNESQDSSIGNTSQDTSISATPLDTASRSLQGKLARVIAATTGGSVGSADVAEGYSPNYQGIYIRTPSGVQTQLFDYTSVLTDTTRVDTIDIDKDGDMDYIYLLDGILYVKYSWQNTPKKILDTTTKISNITPTDLIPYTPDYFHENNSVPKDLNFSFVPSNHDETEWRADFYDRYIEWDHVDIGDHDPKTTPKTTIDMFLSVKNSPISGTPILSTPITRSLDSVQDRDSFVLQGRSIDIYTGALSISLSPGRVLYTGRESVSITYKDITMTGSAESITLDPYTGYEFANITEVMTSGGRLYLMGEQDNTRYTYSDDFIGMPILPGMQLYASDRGAIIRDHTSTQDITLGGGATYITYDLGDKEDGYSVSLPYANGYYYSRLQNLTSKKMDRAGVILFTPQISSDDGAPLVDLPERIRLPIYSTKTYKVDDFLTDLSSATLSIDSDLTIDTDGNGIFDDDFATSGSGFSISTYELVFGKFVTPGNYEMSLKAIDEMGNTTIMPLTVEAYTPVPKIQNVTLSGNLDGSITEAVLETPIHFFRVRSGEVPKILSPEITPTDTAGNFLTGSFFNASENIGLQVGTNIVPVSSHGVFQLPAGYTTDVVPATDAGPMEILILDPAGSISHRHTIGLPDDVIFTDLSKDAASTSTGIFIIPVATAANIVPVSSSDISIPGGVYITNSSHQPLAAMARDGNIYVLEEGITLKYGTKDGYITIDILRSGISIASIEYKIDFFYTSK